MIRLSNTSKKGNLPKWLRTTGLGHRASYIGTFIGSIHIAKPIPFSYWYPQLFAIYYMCVLFMNVGYTGTQALSYSLYEAPKKYKITLSDFNSATCVKNKCW